MKDAEIPDNMPLLPLPARVMLPASILQVRMPAKPRSVSLAEYLVSKPAQASYVAVVPLVPKGNGKRSSTGSVSAVSTDDVASDDLLDIGTAARVMQVARSPQHGDWTLTLEGVCRVHIGSMLRDESHQFYTVGVAAAESAGSRSHEAAWDKQVSAMLQVDLLHKQVARAGGHLFTELQKAVGVEPSPHTARALSNLAPAHTADLFLNLLATTLQDRLAALQAVDLRARLRLALELIRAAREQLEAVASSASASPNAVASRLVNHPALRAITAGPGARQGPAGALRGPFKLGGPQAGAAGGGDDDDEEVSALLKKLKAANPPEEVIKVAMREVKKLQGGAQGNPGSSTARTYLEVLADMPWSTFSHSRKDAELQRLPRTLAQVRELLDEKHYGLAKVKDRIVQYVAVRRLRGWDARAPILCFIGPPGVGKTSLAKSVAEVLGRPLHRISLGGVRDEAEVRGHRRTYVGALPGRIIQGIRRCGVADPVLLLDEIDKLGRDMRGDPAAALLEVLDPEQNSAFVDHYLAVPFDLSKVVFVATANEAATIPAPLLDRLEVIQLSGYTLEEKLHIAERHLLPKLLLEHGLLDAQLQLPAEVLSYIIQHYTREAGVRSLSRCLSAILRHAAVQVVASLDLTPPQAVPSPTPSSSPEGSTQDAADAAAAMAACQPQYNSQQQPTTGDTQMVTRVGTEWQVHGTAVPFRVALATLGGPSQGQGSTEGSPTCSDGHCGGHAEQEGCCSRDVGGAVSSPCDCAASKSARPSQDREPSYWDRLLGLLGMSRAAAPRGVSRNDTHAAVQLQPVRTISRQDTSAVPHWYTSHSTTQQQATANAYLAAAPWQHAAMAVGQEFTATSSYHHAAGHRGWAALQEAPAGPFGRDQRAPSPTPEDGEEEGPTQGPSQGPVVLVVDIGMVEAVLGPPKFMGNEAADRITAPGSAAGLVWTAAGGLVQYVECCAVSDGAEGTVGKLTLTGSMGEVLQESSHIALSWVRAHAAQLGIKQGGLPARCWDIHVHLPTGAVPKDGPSAGITLACALVSLFTGQCCRADTAMTGELSLRGLVLPVGGIKEKLLAAYTAGMRRVILSKRNERDVVAHVPEKIWEQLQVVYCETLQDVLREAFDPPITMQPVSKL